MHNGVYQTLAEVVDFYDRGGGQGIGARVGNQTLVPTPLHLTAQEKVDLIAFLEALRASLPVR
jgi:cytochrome c peroxidase